MKLLMCFRVKFISFCHWNSKWR